MTHCGGARWPDAARSRRILLVSGSSQVGRVSTSCGAPRHPFRMSPPRGGEEAGECVRRKVPVHPVEITMYAEGGKRPIQARPRAGSEKFGGDARRSLWPQTRLRASRPRRLPEPYGLATLLPRAQSVRTGCVRGRRHSRVLEMVARAIFWALRSDLVRGLDSAAASDKARAFAQRPKHSRRSDP